MDIIKIREGKVGLSVPNPDTYKLDSKMPVFFNSVMRFNRDISVILLKSLNKKMVCLDLLGASGARGVRIAEEVPHSQVTINDANPTAVELMQKNVKQNSLNVGVSHSSAFKFLRENKQKWDYIDIDPFGTPMPFVGPAIERLSANGILAVTATDTSALCGTYPSACVRKYNSKSLRCPIMHELGLRILINAVQDVARSKGVYLKPIFSHSTNHYMRVYLKRIKFDPDQRGYVHYNFKTGGFKGRKTQPKKDYAGPLWLGNLWDPSLIKKMIKTLSRSETNHFSIDQAGMVKYLDEANTDTLGFYDLHSLAKIYSLPQLPKRDYITKKLRAKKYKVALTHFTPTGIKTNAKIKEVVNLLGPHDQ